MPESLKTPQGERWARANAAAIFLVLVFFTVMPVNVYLWQSVYDSLFSLVPPVLAAFYFYFCRLRGGTELRLLVAFFLWYFLSRLLNGGDCLTADFIGVRDYSLYFLCAAAGLMLDRDRRGRFYALCCAALGLYYSALALTGIYCAVYRVTLINPLTEQNICAMDANYFSRLAMMDHNPNITALWFFIGGSAVFYLFLRSKRLGFKIFWLFCALLNYLALGLTYSRNTMGSFAVAAAMFCMLLALKYLPLRRLWQKAAVLGLTALVVLPLAYMSFGLATAGIGRISAAVNEAEAAPVAARAEAPQPVALGLELGEAGTISADQDKLFSDPRDLSEGLGNFSGRLPIFASAFKTLALDPARIFRGCPTEELMSLANPLLPRDYIHFHNGFLQVLVLTGLPGFLLEMAFIVLLIIKMLRLFFTEEPALGLEHKFLALPLAGILIYNMLEISIYCKADSSVQFFFITAGVLLGFCNELPSKRKAG